MLGRTIRPPSRSMELPADSEWIPLSSLSPLPVLRPGKSRERRKGDARKRFARKAFSRPKSWRDRPASALSHLSHLSLPSPREQDDMLSASTVLRAALAGSLTPSPPLQDAPIWSLCSSKSSDKRESSPCSEVGEYNLSATGLTRCGLQPRVPLSTLQLLEAEVAGQNAECHEPSGASGQVERSHSNRLPWIEGAGYRVDVDTCRPAGAENMKWQGACVNLPDAELPDAARLKHPTKSKKPKLPTHLRPRAHVGVPGALSEKSTDERRSCTRPRRRQPADREVRRLQRAQSLL
ncbi:unnamed protein product [Effrenium voratum]|nr:unnamed protein product [Effrenium voratum]CAJ1451756.1 unnamed protein product [Effrenium voratum]